ncbi:MAG: hypothetical protein U0165_11595 [Polyangiaceae bacterium]
MPRAFAQPASTPAHPDGCTAQSIEDESCAAWDPLAPRFLKDEHGHPYRISFDPSSRIRIGVAMPLVGAHHVEPSSTEVSLGIAYRSFWVWGVGESRVSWQLDHKILNGWVRPAARSWLSSRTSSLDPRDSRDPSNEPPFTGSLYAVSGLRHDSSPRAVLPTSPPRSVPFPFDVGFDAEVGRFSSPMTPPSSRVDGSALRTIRAAVMRGSLFLDPWRSGRPGRSLELGVGPRYDLDLVAVRGSREGWSTVHRVAPFTATSIRFRWQDNDGLTAIDLRAEVVPHWTTERHWATLFLSSAHAERALFAIDDQPIALALDFTAERHPQSELARASTEIRGVAGLVFGLNLR